MSGPRGPPPPFRLPQDLEVARVPSPILACMHPDDHRDLEGPGFYQDVKFRYRRTRGYSLPFPVAAVVGLLAVRTTVLSRPSEKYAAHSVWTSAVVGVDPASGTGYVAVCHGLEGKREDGSACLRRLDSRLS